MSLVELFSALGDPTRSRVVELLHDKSRPVHELAAAFDISRPAISRHLKVLKDAGLVKEEKAGRENVYSLQRSRLKAVLDWLEKQRAPKPASKTAAKPKPGPKAITAPKPEPTATKRPAKPPRELAAPSTAAPQLSFFDL